MGCFFHDKHASWNVRLGQYVIIFEIWSLSCDSNCHAWLGGSADSNCILLALRVPSHIAYWNFKSFDFQCCQTHAYADPGYPVVVRENCRIWWWMSQFKSILIVRDLVRKMISQGCKMQFSTFWLATISHLFYSIQFNMYQYILTHMCGSAYVCYACH